MKPRLLLLGDMGCGKSSLIARCLGAEASRAGGFVTLRRREGERLLGFDLAPARALVEEDAPRQSFLDFTGRTRRDDTVFSSLGVRLLEAAAEYPFALADEFGGLELEIPEFRQALYRFLSREVPCVGVVKNDAAADALASRAGLGGEYARQYRLLREYLEKDPNTRLLEVSGWKDTEAQRVLEDWAKTYVRK